MREEAEKRVRRREREREVIERRTGGGEENRERGNGLDASRASKLTCSAVKSEENRTVSGSHVTRAGSQTATGVLAAL